MDLLFPNLLNRQQLIFVIQERQLSITNLETMSKDELSAIFKKHIMPKPMRQSNNSTHSCDIEMKNLSSDSSCEQISNNIKKIKLDRCTTVKSNQTLQHTTATNYSKKRQANEQLSNNNYSDQSKRTKISWP